MSENNYTSSLKVMAISFAIFLISFMIFMIEDSNLEEECVTEYQQDYGAAPSHNYVEVCTTETTIIQSLSSAISLISLAVSLGALMIYSYNYERKRVKQVFEEAKQKKVLLKNKAKNFENEKNYSSAITIWEELNMKSEVTRVMKMQAKELEENKNYSSAISIWRRLNMEDEVTRVMMNQAHEREKARDYEPAIDIWENLGEIKEAARVRTLQAELGAVKVAQKVIQGDEVTEIKDSVLNRSNIGSSGDDKFARLEKLTEMKKEGMIDDGEFKQMKKEILGK